MALQKVIQILKITSPFIKIFMEIKCFDPKTVTSGV